MSAYNPNNQLFSFPKGPTVPRSKIAFTVTAWATTSNSAVKLNDAPFEQTGTAFSYVSNSTIGTTILILEPGLYYANFQASDGGAGIVYTLAKNGISNAIASATPTSPVAQNSPEILARAGVTISNSGIGGALFEAMPGDTVAIYYSAQNTPQSAFLRAVKVA